MTSGHDHEASTMDVPRAARNVIGVAPPSQQTAQWHNTVQPPAHAPALPRPAEPSRASPAMRATPPWLPRFMITHTIILCGFRNGLVGFITHVCNM